MPPRVQSVATVFGLHHELANLSQRNGRPSREVRRYQHNATKMKNIKVPVPSLAEQKKFVAKVEALEKQIADAQAVIDASPVRKVAVMKKHL